MPAAVAQRVTARPIAGIALAVLIGVVATWGGLTMAYYTSYPSGFCITTFAFAAFIAVGRVRVRRVRVGRVRVGRVRVRRVGVGA
jgi:zinc/manganese transport system permease protein